MVVDADTVQTRAALKGQTESQRGPNGILAENIQHSTHSKRLHLVK